MRVVLCLAAVAVGSVVVRAGEEKVSLDKLPKPIVDVVRKRFPKLEMTGASKEKEKVFYEVSLKKDGKTIDVTVSPDGTITLIEQQLDFKELPRAVAKAFEEQYPNAKCHIIESVTKVADGKETLEYYEATLVADRKKWEVEVLPDGKFKSATEVKEGK
jgi:hypothetical protein